MGSLQQIMPSTASVAIGAMMVATLMPLFFAYIAKHLGGFRMADNQHPRQFLHHLTGKAARANAVQQNSYETLTAFLVSVVVAMLFFVPQSVVNHLAVMYVVIRFAYGMAYILNMPTFRSILWALSMACILLLFYLSLRISL